MPDEPDGARRLEVVAAHHERATVRVGEMYVKLDVDPSNTARELEAMALAPVPTPEVLWHHPSALALAVVPGRQLARLGQPSPTPPEAWTAAGAVVRALHDAPLPPWPGPDAGERVAGLDRECAWLLEHDVVAADVVRRNREVAEAALAPSTPVFVHGDLQAEHVFVDEQQRVRGVIDWSEAAPGDAHYDLAVLTLGHEDQLDDVLAGYGDADRDVIEGWWSMRCLTAIRWLVEHGYDPFTPGCEGDVLLSRM